MTDKHLYLSLIPQALIASMLKPEEFGSYYAVGTKVHVQGEAIFFEVDPSFRSDDFPFQLADERCVPKPDGSPKNSVYLSIYRVLSRVPVAALGNLYLVTNDGKTLELQREEYQPHPSERLHLYQEFCPITPMVASRLEPHEFSDFITNPTNPVHVPRIVFSELNLGELADNPEHGSTDDIPYSNIDHLRDVLLELTNNHGKPSKLVLKQVKEGVIYRMVQGGFYVGDQNDFAYYRFPDLAELEDRYRGWWRSAQVTGLE
ncbi:hypothetical protein [Thiocystis violascens]|uniref:Uncharacterized protein n=1 Tax=Thiocystis violascens (strain ATCC 17096 / DSM 198 / 6111) TaxID=765911 RepID=I3YEL1_THIV6|nr:hypothetical protein [Thiocystis violascens]AFL75429.1 hypothetical protein Thivi_3566 [Thiocystis violascens DSM 198]